MLILKYLTLRAYNVKPILQSKIKRCFLLSINQHELLAMM